MPSSHTTGRVGWSCVPSFQFFFFFPALGVIVFCLAAASPKGCVGSSLATKANGTTT